MLRMDDDHEDLQRQEDLQDIELSLLSPRLPIGVIIAVILFLFLALYIKQNPDSLLEHLFTRHG